MIASNDSTYKPSQSDLTIVEIEPEQFPWQTYSLGSSDHISQILDQVKNVFNLPLPNCLASLRQCCHLLLIEQNAISHLVLQVSFLQGCLIHLDKCECHREHQGKQPEECRTFSGLSLVNSLKHFDLGEDLKVVKEPIEKEAKSYQYAEDLLMLRGLLLLELLELLVFYKAFEQPEEFSGISHSL